MMFGLRETFGYFECAVCGCCQLVDRPASLARYYPPEYYAFTAAPKPPRTGWRQWVDRYRTRAQLLDRRGIWGSLARLRPRVDLAFLRPAPLPGLHARILDVGCGNGSLLCKLANAGCRDLVGVDPLSPADRQLGPHVRLLARSLASLAGERFDLIMFHHSLEHMPDTLEALATASRLLRRGGVCIVRVPVASCEAWSLYGTDWVELDAPRHFFLHTPRSLDLAARRCGLSIYHTDYEPLSMAYWGSEMYRRGITLFDDERGAMRSPRSVFSAPALQAFESQARRAVRQGRGGPAAFYLRRAA
jgi:SAM-dependent methyltransferase